MLKPTLPAGILAVGDELLFGGTHDTNSQWLTRHLDEAGATVVRRAVVGDDPNEIGAALRWLREEAALVVVTGGLGPTHDDVTREAVAAELGVELEASPELLEALRARFRARGIDPMPAGNARQALAPHADRGSVLPNPLGSAPGLWFDMGGVVVCVPGVPREMKEIFAGSIVPRMHERWADTLAVPVHRFIRTYGVAESILAQEVAQALPEGGGPVSIAFLPHLGSVDIRLTVTGETPAQANRLLEGVTSRLEPVASRHRFESELGDLAHATSHLLDIRGLTLSVAESCTAGRISHRITTHSGASRVFLGGVIAYDDRLKRELLAVPEDVLREQGAVSEAVASAMAEGVRGLTGSDCGIGVTGVAGPTGGSPEKPVGLVWYAACVGDRLRVESRDFPGNRDGVRERASQAALGLLHRMLLDLPRA